MFWGREFVREVSEIIKPITGLFMLAVMVFMLLARATDISIFSLISYCAAGGVFLCSWRFVGLREVYLLALCSGLTFVALFGLNMPWSVFEAAISQAVFLMGFLLLLALLHETAVTSPAVTACGQYLTRQPPARRYFAVFGGTNFMSILFNLGIISLLTPLIKKGVETEQPDIAAIREQRQLTAMLRGFSWGVVWSPTAIAPLAVLELIDGISRELWTVYGLICAAVICLVGWAEDRWRFRHLRRSSARLRQQAILPLPALIGFLSVLILLFSLTVLISSLSGDSFVFGLLVSCPMVMLVWLWGQNRHTDSTPATAVRLAKNICLHQLPNNAKIMLALASSGYIGRLSAEMVPAEDLATMLGLMSMPDYVVLICLAVIMMPFSWLGVSPIMMAVFFGTLLGSLPVLPVDPTLAALAISSGWALSMTTSPFATVVLMMSSMNGKRPLQLTLGWNFTFSALATLCLCVIFFVLTGGR